VLAVRRNFIEAEIGQLQSFLNPITLESSTSCWGLASLATRAISMQISGSC
jgi:hypothetical protein